MAEKTYNITLTANHQALTAEYLPLAAESVQYLTAKVVCETEDWTGREIKALFGQGCTVYEIPVTGGEITAKQQLNLTAGDWCVWLVGNSAQDGEVIPRITTNIAHISVAPTGGTEGSPFPATPPTVEERLRADMGNLADLTTEDKSSLVAAINEAAASGGSKDAVTYTPQTLTTEQQKQARTNIGAGQPVFAVNLTEVSQGGGYTADKTAAEIEAAYQAGRTIVCKMQARILIGYIPIELPLMSRTKERVFIFAVDQLARENVIFAITVNISDSRVEVSNNMVEIYKQPVGGIPKSDLADDVQTSLTKADAAISLGLTAATPGQIIKVKTVQDGKPTEWEAVDMPSEGVEWYEVIDMETTENVNDLIISTDKNGRPISGYHALAMVLCFNIPADSTQTSTNGAIWVYPIASNYLSSGTRIITNVSSWKTIDRTFNYFYAGSNRAIFVSGANAGKIFDGSYNNVFDGIRLYIQKADDHLPTGTKVRCLVLSKGWTA